MEYLHALKMDDEKEFKNFMPYFLPEKVKKDSTLYTMLLVGPGATMGEEQIPLRKKSAITKKLA